MDRRQSIKTLALGSFGLTTPLASWSREGEAAIKITQEPNEYAPPVNHTRIPGEYYSGLHLVADGRWLDRFAGLLPSYVNKIARDDLKPAALVERLAAGDGLIWIGNPEGIPKELSVGSFNCSDAELEIAPVENSPLNTSGLKFSSSRAHSAYIAPPKEMPNHNIDEEVRADFLPILEARDRLGNVIGYPGILMSYYAPSLALGRFKGSECFFFFLEKSFEALDIQSWKILFENIIRRRNSGLQVKAFTTNYASYHAGERVQVTTRIQNSRPEAVSLTCRYYLKGPADKNFRLLTEMRRVPAAESDTEALCDFRPGPTTGLWTIRMEMLQDPVQAELLAIEGNPVVIDRRDVGFMVLQQTLQSASIIAFNGPSIVIDGREGFWAGTHYYPSTSWWEWVWRDFRPLNAAEDFRAIRRAGYRIVRVWVDPVIDEPVLRAIDVAIHLAAQNGIVLDICIFTQWARKMGFERSSGEQVLFEYRGARDFNIVSFSLRNLNLQREFVTILAKRWKNTGNIIYNLANEVYIKDPDRSQMDEEVLSWKNIPAQNGTERDTLLFRRWSNEMTAAIRKAGGKQPVMPGYMFSTMNGGDVYLANEDAPVLPWHCYLGPEQTGLTVQYFDPIASNRPLLLEEFGFGKWNPVKNYDGNAHYALGGGAAGAMSYEWGISWLARESCYWPLPLREASMDKSPDPRWFAPYLELNKTWLERGVGLCPTPSGTGYGSIYHGTVFPAAAAVALGRLGLMGNGLQRVSAKEKVYVVVPAVHPEALYAVKEILSALWSAKAIFGIWQESKLGDLPSSAKAILCPHPLTEKAAPILQSLKSKNVQVFDGIESWKSCSALEKVFVSPGEKTQLLSRRTLNGILFTLVVQQPEKQVEINYNHSAVKLGINDFGLIHLVSSGVNMLEGTGEMRINGQLFCAIDGERLIVRAEGEKSLLHAQQVKLIVTGPSRISFARSIRSVSVGDGTGVKKLPVNRPVTMNRDLAIDDQLARYIIYVSFE